MNGDQARSIMIIGIGFHARRIYIPYLSRRSDHTLVLAVGVDLDDRKEDVQRYLTASGFTLELVVVPPIEEGELASECRDRLDYAKNKYNVAGVIISTDPMSHRAYADWALDAGLHILMDKPVSTRKGVCIRADQAEGILADFVHLAAKYESLQSFCKTAFTINTQRRYDPGFGLVCQLIREVTEKFGIPVTSIQATYADGTWVFPSEMLNQDSHPYRHGYGICSHSGYHIFDMLWQFYLAGAIPDKFPEEMEVYSSFLLPVGFAVQLSPSDYTRIFQEPAWTWTLPEYQSLVATHGEVDASIVVRLLRGGLNVCNATVNLQHNSFSRRSWPVAKADLYKGNGRVKHQQFIIQQGPFQCIHIHNFQASDEHDTNNAGKTSVGENNHFDVHVFRNAALFDNTDAYLKYSADDIYSSNDGALLIEKAKYRVIDEFLGFIQGDAPRSSLKSNIDSHSVPVTIMSGTYLSHCLQEAVKLPIDFRCFSPGHV